MSEKINNDRIIKLRTDLNNELKRRNLQVLSFSDTKWLKIYASNIQEIRDGINSIKKNDYTQPILQQSFIKKNDVDEINIIIDTLAKAPKNGGVSTCNAGCTGLCVSCTDCSGSCSGGCKGSCSGGCLSCTSCSDNCSVACSGACTGSCSVCSGCSGTCTGGCNACSGCNGGCSSCTGGCLGSNQS